MLYKIKIKTIYEKIKLFSLTNKHIVKNMKKDLEMLKDLGDGLLSYGPEY